MDRSLVYKMALVATNIGVILFILLLLLYIFVPIIGGGGISANAMFVYGLYVALMLSLRYVLVQRRNGQVVSARAKWCLFSVGILAALLTIPLIIGIPIIITTAMMEFYAYKTRKKSGNQ